MAYIDSLRCCRCLDCGGFTDQAQCPCGSQALFNVAKWLDRDNGQIFSMTVEEIQELEQFVSASLSAREVVKKIDQKEMDS
jgi:hypothetical protein